MNTVKSQPFANGWLLGSLVFDKIFKKKGIVSAISFPLTFL